MSILKNCSEKVENRQKRGQNVILEKTHESKSCWKFFNVLCLSHICIMDKILRFVVDQIWPLPCKATSTCHFRTHGTTRPDTFFHHLFGHNKIGKFMIFHGSTPSSLLMRANFRHGGGGEKFDPSGKGGLSKCWKFLNAFILVFESYVMEKYEILNPGTRLRRKEVIPWIFRTQILTQVNFLSFLVFSIPDNFTVTFKNFKCFTPINCLQLMLF